jgi:hypothetical protein
MNPARRAACHGWLEAQMATNGAARPCRQTGLTIATGQFAWVLNSSVGSQESGTRTESKSEVIFGQKALVQFLTGG